MENNWISVDDGLPGIGVDVLCFFYPSSPVMGGRVIGIKHRFQVEGTSNPEWLRRRLDKNDFGNVSEVTHWMPLPKPPIET